MANPTEMKLTVQLNPAVNIAPWIFIDNANARFISDGFVEALIKVLFNPAYKTVCNPNYLLLQVSPVSNILFLVSLN